MPRLHITYDVPGWAYHRRALALQRYAPSGWKTTISDQYTACEPCDVLLYLPYGSLKLVGRYVSRLPAKPVIVSGYNVGYGYRRELLNGCLVHADCVILNNRENWERLGRPDKTVWISNGVDLEQFRVTVPLENRKPKAIFIGSKYHYDCNADLKGVDILEAIRPDLEATGIECEWKTIDSIHPPMSADDIRDWYNSATVYVVASRCEGTPNPAIEAAACGCSVVGTLVGNMPELIQHGTNGLLVERTAESIKAGILDAAKNYRRWGQAMQETIKAWDWKTRSASYYELFAGLINERMAK